MFTRIDGLLPNALRIPGSEDGLKQARVFESAARIAKERLKDAERADVKPLHLRNGVLTYACRSSVSVHALRRAGDGLLEALRREHPESAIAGVRFIIMPFSR